MFSGELYISDKGWSRLDALGASDFKYFTTVADLQHLILRLARNRFNSRQFELLKEVISRDKKGSMISDDTINSVISRMVLKGYLVEEPELEEDEEDDLDIVFPSRN